MTFIYILDNDDGADVGDLNLCLWLCCCCVVVVDVIVVVSLMMNRIDTNIAYINDELI